jgi:hypothetical protein
LFKDYEPLELLNLNWQKHIKSYVIFLFVISTFSFFLLYKLSDEKLSPRAMDLLVLDGHIDQTLRSELSHSGSVVRLPKDSIFDHQQQLQKHENQFLDLQKQIEELKKQKSQRTELTRIISTQVENSIESLYSANPMKLMAFNLKVIVFCLTELKSVSIKLDPVLGTRLASLEMESLFLRAARFHAQSVLGSIRVLRRSQLFMNPSIYLIQTQRLTNLMAEISLDPNYKISELSAQSSWYQVHQLELVYAHFFRQLIYDSQVDLKSQLAQVMGLLKI